MFRKMCRACAEKSVETIIKNASIQNLSDELRVGAIEMRTTLLRRLRLLGAGVHRGVDADPLQRLRLGPGGRLPEVDEEGRRREEAAEPEVPAGRGLATLF